MAKVKTSRTSDREAVLDRNGALCESLLRIVVQRDDTIRRLKTEVYGLHAEIAALTRERDEARAWSAVEHDAASIVVKWDKHAPGEQSD